MKRLALVLVVCALCPMLVDAAAPIVPDDPLPPGALLRLGSARLRHPDRITSLALSRDGRLLASADEKGRIRLWATGDGRMLLELNAGGTSVAFSPDGKTFAVGGVGQQRARLLDVRTGKVLRTFDELTAPCVSLSADGKLVAGGDDKHRIVVCETATGQVVSRLDKLGYKQKATAIAFSRDGKALAVASSEHGVIFLRHRYGSDLVVWELATEKVRCRLVKDGAGPMTSLAFSPDGKALAVATSAYVRIHDPQSGERLREWASTTGFAVRYDDGGRLVTGGILSVREPGRNDPLWKSYRPGDDTANVASSSDGALVASSNYADNLIRLWDGKTGKEHAGRIGHRGEVRAVAWSPDGRFVATGSGDDGTVRLWDAANGRPGPVFVQRGPLYRSRPSLGLSMLAFTPDGRSVLGPGQRWSLDTGRGTVTGATDQPMAYSRDGSLAAFADRKNALQLADAATGRLLHRLLLPGDPYPFWYVTAFSPDGRLVAASPGLPRNDQPKETVHVFETATGKRIMGMRLGLTAPNRMTFSPDGRSLAATEYGLVQVFDVATGRERLRAMAIDGRGEADAVAFSPDGALLAATAGQRDEVVFYEAATGQVVRKWRAHDGFVTSLAFSPDSRLLLSGGADSTAIIWRVLPGVQRKAWDKDAPHHLWDALARDAAKAYEAVAELASSPEEAVAMLAKRLTPDYAVDARTIARHVEDLDDDDFDVRQKADKELAALGARAEPALRQALEGKPPPERLKRVRGLLLRLESPSGDELRDARAIRALEWAATPEAEGLLKRLARGAEGGRKTLAALAALQRFEVSR